MTTEEKKIKIIEKIIDLKDDLIMDTINDLLGGTQVVLNVRKPGWGKGIVTYVSEDFDDFIPPGFPV